MILLNKNIFSKIFIIVIFLSIVFFIPFIALSYDHLHMHPKITQKSIDFLIEYYPDLGINQSYIIQGSTEEDNGDNPAFHSYDPVTGNGWADVFVDAITYATGWRSSYLLDQITTSNYKNNKSDFYHKLGRLCHLIEDMAAPAHVHGDMHAIGGGDDYESFCEKYYNADTTNNHFNNMFLAGAGSNTWQDFMKALAWATYQASSFQAKLQDSNPQPDSELKKMFPSLKYVSISWEGVWYYDIENIGEYWPIAGNSDWWPCSSDTNYVYIENTGGENGGGVFPQDHRKDLTERNSSMIGYNDNTSLNNLWKKTLLPLAASCVAGYLNEVAMNTIPLSVQLPIITIEHVNNTNLINWKSNFEGNKGYWNIYRKEELQDEFTKINHKLIPASKHSSQFLDKKIVSGKQYSYKIEHVNLSGESEIFGPVQTGNL